MTRRFEAQAVLVADVGNTSVHFAIFRNGRIARQFRVKTGAPPSLWKTAVARGLCGTRPVGAGIASVVPARGRFLRGLLKGVTDGPVWLLGEDLAVPIRARVRSASQIGIDRLVNALAAHRLYGKAAVIVDFGTAITLDVVSREGDYLGGVIAPGIEISLDALKERTALLPRIRLKHPKAVLGKDTVECMRIGCSIGIGGLCDRLVQRLKRQLGGRPVVLATGGYAAFMRRYCREIQRVEPSLTLKGIFWTVKNHLTASRS